MSSSYEERQGETARMELVRYKYQELRLSPAGKAAAGVRGTVGMTAQPSIKKADAGADRAAAMYELYAGGATLEQVGARHNMSRERVRQIFRRYGYSMRSLREIAARTHALEVDRAEDILSMHTELKDVREVARRLGVSQTMVRDVVRAAERANPQPASRSRRKFGSTRKRYSDSELLECLKIASQEARWRSDDRSVHRLR